MPWSCRPNSPRPRKRVKETALISSGIASASGDAALPAGGLVARAELAWPPRAMRRDRPWRGRTALCSPRSTRLMTGECEPSCSGIFLLQRPEGRLGLGFGRLRGHLIPGIGPRPRSSRAVPGAPAAGCSAADTARLGRSRRQRGLGGIRRQRQRRIRGGRRRAARAAAADLPCGRLFGGAGDSAAAVTGTAAASA